MFPWLSDRRRPAIIALALIVAILGMAAVFKLGKGLHRAYELRHMRESSQPQAPAGLGAANFSVDGLELSGWAPPGAVIRLVDRDKTAVAATADEDGKWDLSFADEHHRSVRSFALSYRAGGKPGAEIGRLTMFVPDASPDDSYVWLRGDANAPPRILQIPESEEEGLFLTQAWLREGRTLVFAGHGAPGGLIQLYADNQLAGTAGADGRGRWVLQSLLGADKKSAALRLDGIRETGRVHARRTYRLSWPDDQGGDNIEPVVLRAAADGWIVNEASGDSRELLYVLRPGAGAVMAPDKELPGQVIPGPSAK